MCHPSCRSEPGSGHRWHQWLRRRRRAQGSSCRPPPTSSPRWTHSSDRQDRQTDRQVYTDCCGIGEQKDRWTDKQVYTDCSATGKKGWRSSMRAGGLQVQRPIKICLTETCGERQTSRVSPVWGSYLWGGGAICAYLWVGGAYGCCLYTSLPVGCMVSLHSPRSHSILSIRQYGDGADSQSPDRERDRRLTWTASEGCVCVCACVRACVCITSATVSTQNMEACSGSTPSIFIPTLKPTLLLGKDWDCERDRQVRETCDSVW